MASQSEARGVTDWVTVSYPPPQKFRVSPLGRPRLIRWAGALYLSMAVKAKLQRRYFLDSGTSSKQPLPPNGAIARARRRARRLDRGRLAEC